MSAVGHATFVVCKEEIKAISYFLLHSFCTESIVDQIVSFVAGGRVVIIVQWLYSSGYFRISLLNCSLLATGRSV